MQDAFAEWEQMKTVGGVTKQCEHCHKPPDLAIEDDRIAPFHLPLAPSSCDEEVTNTSHQASVEAGTEQYYANDFDPDDWHLPEQYHGPKPEWVSRVTRDGKGKGYDGFKIFVGDLDSREQGEMIHGWLQQAMQEEGTEADWYAYQMISDINVTPPNEGSRWGNWKASCYHGFHGFVGSCQHVCS